MVWCLVVVCLLFGKSSKFVASRVVDVFGLVSRSRVGTY